MAVEIKILGNLVLSGIGSEEWGAAVLLENIFKNEFKNKNEINGTILIKPNFKAVGEDPEDIALIRAIAVHNFLVANEIDDSRLLYKSFGSSQPIHKIPEKNEKERNENRRVEILILEN